MAKTENYNIFRIKEDYKKLGEIVLRAGVAIEVNVLTMFDAFREMELDLVAKHDDTVIEMSTGKGLEIYATKTKFKGGLYSIIVKEEEKLFGPKQRNIYLGMGDVLTDARDPIRIPEGRCIRGDCRVGSDSFVGNNLLVKSTQFFDKLRTKFHGSPEFASFVLGHMKQLPEIVNKCLAHNMAKIYEMESKPRGFVESLEFTLQKRFALDLYKKNPETFKMYFSGLSEENQTDLCMVLLYNKNPNKALDKWISENYPSVAETAGMELILSKPKNGPSKEVVRALAVVQKFLQEQNGNR